LWDGGYSLYWAHYIWKLEEVTLPTLKSQFMS
jgi:hypothetical protein